MSAWSATQQPPGVNQTSTETQSYTYAAYPAYTPVQVRQGFGSYPAFPVQGAYGALPPPPPPQSMTATPATAAPVANHSTNPTKEKTEWPASVRSYVQRSFLPQNDEPGVSRSEIERKLKETIGTAKESGKLFTIDWDNMPLPQALVKADREALSMSTSPRVNSKKRKSSELSRNPDTWNSHGSLEDRITSAPSTKQSKDVASKRKRRFENEYKASESSSPSPPPHTAGPIVGTSEKLEKKYLRLTAPPVPANVRPERILRQTLELLKKKWRKENNYSYICDQFKSMRQDLTVQRIKNDFTVSVYEIHARIALEKGDIGEYNQCQTQLRSLYALGLRGNPIEFKAYRILYFIHTANRSGLNDTLADLTPTEKEQPPIKHALDVRSALALGNFHKFFKLYMDTPNMGAYLMDMFVGRERLAALCMMCRAYRPDVPLRYITEELQFESDADAAQFVCDHNGQELLQSRGEDIIFLTGKAGGLLEAARSAAFQTVDIKGQI